MSSYIINHTCKVDIRITPMFFSWLKNYYSSQNIQISQLLEPIEKDGTDVYVIQYTMDSELSSIELLENVQNTFNQELYIQFNAAALCFSSIMRNI